MKNEEIKLLQDIWELLREKEYIINDIRLDNFLKKLEKIIDKNTQRQIKNKERINKSHFKSGKKQYKIHLLKNNYYNARKRKDFAKMRFYKNKINELRGVK